MKRFLFLIMMAVSLVVFSSCGKDDDTNQDVDLKSYIVGTWHSYRMTAFGNGKQVSADVTKNNEYSAAYMEMNFSSNGTVIISGWQQNGDGTSRWITENGTYSIDGHIVHVRENNVSVDTEWNDGMTFNPSIAGMTRSGSDAEVISFVFEPSSRSLYIRFTQMVGGINVVGDLYLRK